LLFPFLHIHTQLHLPPPVVSTMPRFRKSSHSFEEFRDGRHRFEHWYRDNTVYFITARCRDRFAAFASKRAKEVFWDRFEYHTAALQFEPWVTSRSEEHTSELQSRE